jgi:hypothetical protein
VQVREITAPAAGDQDFLANPIRAFEYQNAPAPFSGFDSTHQAGRARSENDDVVFLIHAVPFKQYRLHNKTYRRIKLVI